MMLANVPVVLFGDAIARRLPLKIVRRRRRRTVRCASVRPVGPWRPIMPSALQVPSALP